MTRMHITEVSVATELVTPWFSFLLATAALSLRFKLNVHGFGFYPSTFLKLKTMGYKTDNPYNLTKCPLQTKLQWYPAVKT